MGYLDDSAAQLTLFEEKVNYMYLDKVGKVTVGVGEMLPTPASAQDLPFVDSTGADASTDDIAADYERVAAMNPDMLARDYQCPTSLQLPDNVISSLLMATVQGFDADLSAELPDYDTFPEAARLGLLDMIYNLGKSGLFNGFPTFMGYVRDTDWANAATECHRLGISDERNAWTAQQFTDAAGLQAAGAGPGN